MITLYVNCSVRRSFNVGMIHIGVLGAIRLYIHYVKLGRYHFVMEVRVQEVMIIFLCCSHHIIMLLIN